MKNYVYYDAYHRRRRVRGSLFLKHLKGKRGIFLLSFFIAMILGKIVLWDDICQYQNWNATCIGKLNIETLDQRSLLTYLLIHRGELVLFLVLSGITKLRKILYYVCSGMAGGVLGVLLLSFFHSFGIKGVIILFISLVPHWIIYGMLFVYMYWLFVKRTEEKRNHKGKNDDTLSWYALYALGALILFGVGIYLECFVNPLLLNWTKVILKI